MISKNLVINRLKDILHDQLAFTNSLSGKDLTSYNGSGWTPAQIFNHILEAQEASINKIVYRHEKGHLPAVDLKNRFNYVLLRLFFGFNLKTKVPRILNASPENKGTIEHFVEEFEIQHQKLLKVMEKYSPDELRQAIFKHPLSGNMNAKMTVTFFGLHWNHHRKQIKERI